MATGDVEGGGVVKPWSVAHTWPLPAPRKICAPVNSVSYNLDCLLARRRTLLAPRYQVVLHLTSVHSPLIPRPMMREELPNPHVNSPRNPPNNPPPAMSSPMEMSYEHPTLPLWDAFTKQQSVVTTQRWKVSMMVWEVV